MADQAPLELIAEALDLGEGPHSFADVLSAAWQLKTERDELRYQQQHVDDQHSELDDLLEGIAIDHDRQTTFFDAFAFAGRVLELIRDGIDDEEYREGCRRLIDMFDSLHVRIHESHESLDRGMAQAAAGELESHGSFAQYAQDEGEPGG